MPDFHKEPSRKAFENDHWSPWPSHAAPGQPPDSIRGFIKPKAEVVTRARKVWGNRD